MEPSDDRIDPPPEREAPSRPRPYREASLCDVVMFFSLSRFGSVSKVLSLSVLSQSRRSRIASALSLHPCNATLGACAARATALYAIARSLYATPIPSVCPSVTCVYCIKTAESIIEIPSFQLGTVTLTAWLVVVVGKSNACMSALERAARYAEM